MPDFLGLMKQAAELKSKMETMQAELDRMEVEGTAGGGMITLKISGKGDLRGVHVDETLLKPDQKEIVEDLIALAAEKRDVSLKSALERDVRLVRFEDGQLEIALEASAAKMLVGDLSKKLHDWTGRRWMVVVSAEPGAPSLRSQAEERKTQLKSDARSDPLVQAVLTRFPGAEIVEVRPPAGAPATTDDLPETPDNESDPDA